MIIEVEHTAENGEQIPSIDIEWNKTGDCYMLWFPDLDTMYDYRFFINKKKFYEAKKGTSLKIVREEIDIACLNFTRKEKLACLVSQLSNDLGTV